MISVRRRLALIALAAFFVAPYFVGLFISKFALRLPNDFFQLVMISTTQAALSALVSLALGMLGAMGLLSRSQRWESLALAPAVTPAIAIVLGFISIFPQWKGWSAVVAAHALGASGLVAVVIARQIRGTIGASLELAWVEGASRPTMWWRGVFPSVRENLVRLGLTIFAVSLASFSIPLLLGGSKAVTVEIAIHHAIRFENAWDVAAALSIFQWMMLLAFVLLLRRPSVSLDRRVESVQRGEVGRMLGSPLAFSVLLVTPAIVLYALLRGPFAGWAQLKSAGLFDQRDILILGLQGSFVTATVSGLIAAFLLVAFAAVYPNERQRVWMSGYVAPSVAITGFATLAIGWGQRPSFTVDSLRIAVGAALLFAPVLWRLRWEQSLAHLAGQVKVAQTLGASHGMTVRRVILPQMRELFFWSAGLVSFWVWSDYGLGSIAASRSMTLGLLAKSLLESYRLEAASILILVCILLGGLSYRIISLGDARRVAR